MSTLKASIFLIVSQAPSVNYVATSLSEGGLFGSIGAMPENEIPPALRGIFIKELDKR